MGCCPIRPGRRTVPTRRLPSTRGPASRWPAATQSGSAHVSAAMAKAGTMPHGLFKAETIFGQFKADIALQLRRHQAFTQVISFNLPTDAEQADAGSPFATQIDPGQPDCCAHHWIITWPKSKSVRWLSARTSDAAPMRLEYAPSSPTAKAWTWARTAAPEISWLPGSPAPVTSV